MKRMIVAIGIATVLSGGCTFNITFNITGTVPARPASGSPMPEEGVLHVYPPELRAGDIVADEHGDQWELVSGATRAPGALEFVAPVRRVDAPADGQAETREARWRATERVKIRRSTVREAPSKP